MLLLAACGSATNSQTKSTLSLPAGFHAEIVAEGLQSPTQMLLASDGVLWVAQLGGAENAGTSQVVAVSLRDGRQGVLLDGLPKLTGIALLGNALWLASGRDLLRAPVQNGSVGKPEIVLHDLPFNGRSNGTLNVTPDGKLLYETSGNRTGSNAGAGSATLWLLDPNQPNAPKPLATGLKGAYGHTVDAAGRIWTTEIGDDPVDGKTPPDELNLVIAGADFGWPQCYGDRTPATNYGGTAERCQQTRAPVALFPPGATPTSVAVAPWDANTMLVALWNTADGQVVQVKTIPAGDNATGTVTPFITGLKHPQHLLAMADGSVLISDFGSGMVYRVSK